MANSLPSAPSDDNPGAAADRAVDAVILVRGLGTRLCPWSIGTPKLLLSSANHRVLQRLFARTKDARIKHVVMSMSCKAEVFEEYFGDGSEMGLDIEYVVEETALGTGGGIRNVYDYLQHDTVMVFNGDVLSGMDLG